MATEAYALKIGATLGGAWVENVLHYLVDNDTDLINFSMAQRLVNAWDASVKTAWLGTLPSAYILQWVEARRSSAGGGRSWWIEYPNSATFGSLGTTTSGLQTAPIIKLYPGMGFDTQGRVYMPGISEAQLVDNEIFATYRTAIDTLIAAWDSISNGGSTFQLAIRSPKLGQTVPVVEAALGPIIGNIGRRRIPH